MAIISIKTLKVDGIIGIYEHELNQTQPLIFDVDMVSDINQAARSDLIEHALDYASVASRIESIVSKTARSCSKHLLKISLKF